MSGPGIGEPALLAFIDEINTIRAKSGNRYRFRPQRLDNGVLGMKEHYAIERPGRADAYSPRYSQ